MLYTLETLHKAVFSKVYDVYEIFKSFFGEDYVDLQFPSYYRRRYLIPSGISEAELETTDIDQERFNAIVESIRIHCIPNILVWWPEVTVSNENGRSIQIYDLYASIQVDCDGNIPVDSYGFQLVRSTFTEDQYNSGYMHSHTPRVSGLPHFEHPCLGRGPIRRTISALKGTFDEVNWMMFCSELALYVTVESIAGGPYIFMKDVGTYTIPLILNISEKYDRGKIKKYYDDILDFARYYLTHNSLKLGFAEDSFQINIPAYELVMDMSNRFITWVNENKTAEDASAYYRDKIILRAAVKERKFFIARNSRNTNTEYIGEKILTFKNQDIVLKIIESTHDNSLSTILSQDIVNFIIQNIINILDYHYGYEDRESTPATHKKAVYI